MMVSPFIDFPPGFTVRDLHHIYEMMYRLSPDFDGEYHTWSETGIRLDDVEVDHDALLKALDGHEWDVKPIVTFWDEDDVLQSARFDGSQDAERTELRMDLDDESKTLILEGKKRSVTLLSTPRAIGETFTIGDREYEVVRVYIMPLCDALNFYESEGHHSRVQMLSDIRKYRPSVRPGSKVYVHIISECETDAYLMDLEDGE